MRRKLLISLALAALLLLIIPGQISYATPSLPYILVNESTRQCYVSIMNDECFWCDPPSGWKILGPGNPSYGTTDCPAGYEKIDHLELDCRRYKSRECCGMLSSHGDCEDMVINATQQACAFVDDIRACTLPEGWSKRPTDIPEGNWSCNFGLNYHWVEGVTCLTAVPTPAVLGVGNIPVERQRPEALPVTGIGLILLGGGTLVWLATKRVKR